MVRVGDRKGAPFNFRKHHPRCLNFRLACPPSLSVWRREGASNKDFRSLVIVFFLVVVRVFFLPLLSELKEASPPLRRHRLKQQDAPPPLAVSERGEQKVNNALSQLR